MEISQNIARVTLYYASAKPGHSSPAMHSKYAQMTLEEITAYSDYNAI